MSRSALIPDRHASDPATDHDRVDGIHGTPDLRDLRQR
jgi:hypothetical protein